MPNWNFFKWICSPDKRMKVEILRTSFSSRDDKEKQHDLCQFCAKERQFHRRGSDHPFKEKEDD